MRLPRASGVLLHPTSLPGPHGSGDLGPSAYHFVDWLVAAGQKLWQILPLGGIGAGNSPYMSSSAFAGNLLLIDLAELHQRGWLSPRDLQPDPGLQPQRVDFAAVVPYRMQRLERAAAAFAAQATPLERAEFDGFCAGQRHWLDDYALFMALVEQQGHGEWCDWPEPLARHDESALQGFAQQHAGRVMFWKFSQWCFLRQWLRLKAYANERGVRIFGDAPIFIAYQSAEVWARPELFELDARGRLEVVAGVPPDAFSATGQRWGNPLYRWSAHAQEGYAWWVQRIRHTFEWVDIVRIDHFRGFAGYWEIEASEPTAVKGRWMPGPGAALFEAIATALGPLPVIAEDLGVITPDVLALRKAFHFPGMKVLHFAFGGDSGNLYLPHNHEADSVVYTGTHDNDTTLGWWASLNTGEREHVARYLGVEADQVGSHLHWHLIRAALASVADTAIVPMQDLLGLDGRHRMNFPGFGEGYWEWRFSWDQVTPEHADQMAALCRLFRRDGTALH